MIDLDRLDPASRAFAHDLFRGSPWLRRSAREEPLPGREAHFLVVHLPCPVQDGSALVVDTGDERIRVQWGRWSAEFDAPADGGRSSELPDAVSLVEDVLAEAVAVYTLWQGERFRGCGTLRDELDERRVLAQLRPGMRLEIASWEGTRDQTLTR